MNKLSAATSKLLSCSQVITNVHSVVKELIENSLDAGSDNLDIRLEKNGISKIEVQDNGFGIQAQDVQYMCKPHYTSKIKDDLDLLKLNSYGFRGEALCSLCTVAEVLVITKTKDDALSKQYCFDSNGNIVNEKPTHHNIGTIVTVRNLFKNLPVRKQIYSNTRKLKEELRIVENLLTSYGLLIPNLRIVLKNDQKEIWRKDRVSNKSNAISTLMGPTMFEQLCVCKEEENLVSIEAYVPQEDCDAVVIGRSQADKIFTFVNRRPVSLKEIKTLLKTYFTEHCCPGNKLKYPVAVIFINVAREMVDVNLEPNKTTVLLQNLGNVLDLLKKILDKLYLRKENTDGSDPIVELHGPPSSDLNAQEGTPTLAVVSEIHSKVSEEECNFKGTKKTIANGEESCFMRNQLPVSHVGLTREADEINSPETEICSNITVVSTPLHQDAAPSIPQQCILQQSTETRSSCSESVMETSNTVEKLAEHSLGKDCDLLPDFDEEFLFLPLTPDKMDDPNKWSRGESRTNVAPVSVLRPTSRQEIVPPLQQRKRKMSSDDDDADEVRHSNQDGRKIQKKIKRRDFAPKVTIPFSLAFISERYKNKRDTVKERECTSSNKEIRIIGKIPDSFLWFVVIKGKMYVMDVTKILEKRLHDQLQQKHKFKGEKLSNPLKLNSSLVGEENWQLLCSLPTEIPLDGLHRYVSHPAITDNGFCIRKIYDTTNDLVTFECTHITKSIECYGTNDLEQILDSIQANIDVTCRPEKVLNWLKGEATRLSQLFGESCSHEEIRNAIEEGSDLNGIITTLCLHGKFVFYEIQC